MSFKGLILQSPFLFSSSEEKDEVKFWINFKASNQINFI